MKILDRYLLRELAGPFVFGVVAFVLLFVSANILFQLTELVSELGISLWVATELFLLKLPEFVVLTFPLATLVAILITFGRLSGDSELIAMHAGGVSFRRLVVPAVAMGLMVSVVTAGMNELVVPGCKRRAEQIVREASQQAGRAGQPGIYLKEMSGGQVARLIYADRLNVATGEMTRPTITWFDKGKPVLVTVAERGQWQANGWQMFNVVNFRLDAEWPEKYWFRSWRAEFATSPREMAERARNPEEMTYGELKEYIRSALRQHEPTVEWELMLHHKFSIPFACLVFALVAPALGMRSHRGSSSIGMGVAILVGFAYYVLWQYFGLVAREGGGVTPFWAAWLPNIVTGVVGIGLIMRVRR